MLVNFNACASRTDGPYGRVQIIVYIYTLFKLSQLYLFDCILSIILLLSKPSHPDNVETTWPNYTTNYITIATNITRKSKFLPERMAFWNNLVPSLTSQQLETTPTPTVMTTTSSSHGNDKQCEKKKGMSEFFLLINVILLNRLTMNIRYCKAPTSVYRVQHKYH